MDPLKIRVTLVLPPDLVLSLTLSEDPSRALEAILSGALAEFRIKVSLRKDANQLLSALIKAARDASQAV